MNLTRFKIQVLVRVVFLFLLSLAGMYFIFKNGAILLGGIFLTCAILVVVSLFYVVNKTNRMLASFLLGIKYDDYEVSYGRRQEEESEKALSSAFNLINDKFRSIRHEKEMQFQYFQALVEQVQTGLLGFDDGGRTIVMNKALQGNLRKSYFPDFDAIRRYDEKLYDLLTGLAVGEQKLYKREFGSDVIQLSIQKTLLKLQGQEYSIYSFQDIHSELQAQEIKSWQKIIRILTHEIMNSVSPILSLANSTEAMFSSNLEIDAENRSEVHAAIQAIKKRSEGLMHFTDTYRKLTKIPAPKFGELEAKELLERVLLLMQNALTESGIKLERLYATYPVIFRGDAEQLEQVFINFIKNAVEAMNDTEVKTLKIGFRRKDEKTYFFFADSGPGIPEEIRDQIFVPFYTTKREGSGIGLSVCQQIIYNHDGTINVQCPEGGGAIFTILL